MVAVNRYAHSNDATNKCTFSRTKSSGYEMLAHEREDSVKQQYGRKIALDACLLGELRTPSWRHVALGYNRSLLPPCTFTTASGSSGMKMYPYSAYASCGCLLTSGDLHSIRRRNGICSRCRSHRAAALLLSSSLSSSVARPTVLTTAAAIQAASTAALLASQHHLAVSTPTFQHQHHHQQRQHAPHLNVLQHQVFSVAAGGIPQAPGGIVVTQPQATRLSNQAFHHPQALITASTMGFLKTDAVAICQQQAIQRQQQSSSTESASSTGYVQHQQPQHIVSVPLSHQAHSHHHVQLQRQQNAVALIQNSRYQVYQQQQEPSFSIAALRGFEMYTHLLKDIHIR